MFGPRVMSPRAVRPRAMTSGAVTLACLLGTAPFQVQPLAAQETPEPIRYRIDGIEVVQRTIPRREVVSVQLHLLGGAQELTPETAGIEALLLRASEYGTEAFPGETLREAQVLTGSRFFVRTAPDWTVLGFTGLAEEFERSWALLTERLARPTLDSAAIALARGQMLTEARSRADDPDAAALALADRLAYAGHPYAAPVDGSEASLAAITQAQLRAFHGERIVRSRILLSVVGAVERSSVESAIQRTLGSLPLGDYRWEPPAPWAHDDAGLIEEARALPTNYIVGHFSGPPSDHEDYPAFEVAVSVLSSYLYDEIRARGLSYAAGAEVLEQAASGGSVFVSTVRPDEAIGVVNEVIDTFRDQALRRDVFRDYAERSSLGYYLANQTSSEQASFLASSILLRGRVGTVDDRIQELRRVAGSDVRRMFLRYIRDIQYAYLGQLHLAPRERMRRF